ncbi:hypothetical protein MAP00_003631 [Monascus purpureus]|nr:hypothetical protein MAP00_003631 [Monascus purpureus]
MMDIIQIGNDAIMVADHYLGTSVDDCLWGVRSNSFIAAVVVFLRNDNPTPSGSEQPFAFNAYLAQESWAITAIAVYTSDDSNHAAFADEAIKISSPLDFTDTGKLVDICKRKSIDAVHPGYGFLSENSEFARALEQDGITFVGPTPDILSCLGDKTAARAMAESCDAAHFVASVGYPVMVKAVDGAGGRGIRLITGPGALQNGFARWEMR